MRWSAPRSTLAESRCMCAIEMAGVFVGSVPAFDRQLPPETTQLFRVPVELGWSYGKVDRILFVSVAHASRFPGFKSA
jgi:hypothetical protein